jgi:hypothetical protein
MTRLSATAIEFGCGNASGPSLLFAPDDTFTMKFEHDQAAEQRWAGSLVGGAFSRILLLLEQAGFPAAEPLKGLVPGTEISDVGAFVNDEWLRARFIDANSAFQPLTTFIYTVVAQVDTKHAQPPPNAPVLVTAVTSA